MRTRPTPLTTIEYFALDELIVCNCVTRAKVPYSYKLEVLFSVEEDEEEEVGEDGPMETDRSPS